MHLRPFLRFSVFALVLSCSWTALRGQDRNQQPTDACPKQPHTLRAMRNCYRPLLVFAPALDNPKLVQEFNQLKAANMELQRRDVMYVPIVPEGHNQPIPVTKVPTARLSEDELAALRHRFQVEPGDFLVILIGKDGEQKLSSPAPVTVIKLEQLIDSMPRRRTEMKQQTQSEP
jgi:Domain of unknown function (DUF4174)